MFDAVNVEDRRVLMICAFRYALGRRTYVVGIVCDALKATWPEMSKGDRRLIQNEIRNHEATFGSLGDECDAAAWREVLQLQQ